MIKAGVKRYGYGRIGKLAEKLAEAGIDEKLTARIMKDGESITASTRQEGKADWMREAMRRMDNLLPEDERHAVRESCACCLGGRRLALSRSIARNNETVAARVKAANETPFVFGHSVKRLANGNIRVSFFPEGQTEFKCVCLRKATEPISITYCYCCGGHVKHHLQIALGEALACRVVSSALSSGGKKPCLFEFSRVPHS